jgi:cytochrome c553
MRRFISGTVLMLALAGVAVAQQSSKPAPAQSEPKLIPWAYALPPALPPGEKPPPLPFSQPEGELTLPGAPATMKRPQLFDMYDAADWWPGDHPPMPPIVKNGRKPQISACGVCHYPNGSGKPDNASVSGLPEAYFVQQMLDYRSGARKSSNPKKSNAAQMGQFARAMTDEEIREAAKYFGAIPYTPRIKVIEAAKVPRHQHAGQLFVRVANEPTEPLGNQILEGPEDAERFENYRDPRVGFVAYVPVGSVRKGRTLATTGGNGRSVACGMCHGEDLRGMGPVPAIAGRSASYIARQLNDFRTGARAGAWSRLMKAATEKLTDEDILVLSAYAASLAP